MRRNELKLSTGTLAALFSLAASLAGPSQAAESVATMQPTTHVLLGLNQSTILENSVGVKRISIANPDVAEAIAVNRNEILVNGKSGGATSMVLWDVKGQRSMYAIQVTGGGMSKPDFVRQQMQQELPGQDIKFEISEGSVFLKGTVDDLVSADRAQALASTLGKVVNLLKVKVPESEPQIMLKVKFANVNRTGLSQLGLNLVSTGATNTFGAISTGQFGSQPTFDFTQQPNTVTFHDLLNIFLYRKDINLGATIQALQSKQLLQILAEPNLLTVSGRPASFLAGGEFPFPTLQGGGAGVGQITIQFREFGIRIKFQPTVTPRGTIRLAVVPEVSALDYSAGLSVSGYTVPGLTSRRVQTEVELGSGQSFVIAGLLDNRTIEVLNKMPGLANIPLIGKLFESRTLQKNNSELMVLVTPELVDPITAGAQKPEIKMTTPFLKNAPTQVPQHPAKQDGTLPSVKTLPIEVLKTWQEPDAFDSGNGAPAPPNGLPAPNPANLPAPVQSAKNNE